MIFLSLHDNFEFLTRNIDSAQTIKVFSVILRRMRKSLVIEAQTGLKVTIKRLKKVNVLEKLHNFLLHFSSEAFFALCLFSSEFEPKYAHKLYAYKKKECN